MFSKDTLVAALVDHLTYHSSVLNMNGTSYRLAKPDKKLNSSLIHEHSGSLIH